MNFRQKMVHGSLFDEAQRFVEAVKCLSTRQKGLVGNILLEENKMIQNEEMKDIEKLMPDIKIETISPIIEGKKN